MIAKEYGSYNNLNGGGIDHALMLITGEPSFRYNLLNEEILLQVADNSLWVKLLEFIQRGFFMGAGTLPTEEIPKDYEPISGRHAYAIIDAFELDGVKLIQLGDPRGISNWNGEWSIHSKKWTSRLKAMIVNRWKIDSEKTTFKPLIKTNSISLLCSQHYFFLSWEEFLKCFEVIFVTVLFDESWNKLSVTGKWEEGCSGGSTLFISSVLNNPQYLMVVPEDTEIFALLLNTMPFNEFDIFKIGFEIYAYNGNLIGNSNNLPELIAIGKYSPERSISLNYNLKEGKYILLISTYEPNHYGSLTFILWHNIQKENRKVITLDRISCN